MQLEVVLKNFFSADYSVLVFTFELTLGNLGASNDDHLRLLGSRIFYLEELRDSGCANDINIGCVARLFLDLFTDVMNEVLNILNVFVDEFVLLDADALSLC